VIISSVIKLLDNKNIFCQKDKKRLSCFEKHFQLFNTEVKNLEEIHLATYSQKGKTEKDLAKENIF